MTSKMDRWRDARYGLFIHYGLYSLLGRGEWVLNREAIPVDEYKKLADEFSADKMDFGALLAHAREKWGVRYAVLTCKHHDGFCLYDSKLTDFTAPKTRCGRDLVGEFVEACRKNDFPVCLYHTLGDWTASPDAIDALENPDEYHQPFIDFVHGQIREIMTNYGEIDVMWYDGWWPFDGEGWQAERLNAMVRELQPGILVNGRCGVPGDFDTPEQHVQGAGDGRAWEACMTLNNNWGYHAGDDNWKSPMTVADMLRQCACGQGNLLLNIGPRGDGSIPEASDEILTTVGTWLKANGEALFNTDRFTFTLNGSPEDRSDFTHHGLFSARDNYLYWHLRCWPGERFALNGVEFTALEVDEPATGKTCSFRQEGRRLVIEGADKARRLEVPAVLRIKADRPPRLYGCGGLRPPKVPHCRYDPLPSDMPPML